MPEGPELHLASRYINRVCRGVVFSGRVEKSEVSKNPEVPFQSEAYLISAASRGKELKLTLTPVAEAERGPAGPVDVVFRFGMSGLFKLAPEGEVHKHAHLRFRTKERPVKVLCFVDTRRFGSWEVNGMWQRDRGPCIMFEYENFRANVLKNLSDKAFDKPICEALLNQKYFNGIGNYLRAEILYRLKIPPFVKARTVLEPILQNEQDSKLTLSKKIKVKMENPDLLELCHTVPLEVVNMGGKGYDPEHLDDYSPFEGWLQCYSVPGMKTLRDGNGRTMWFQGEAGPMAPKDSKSPKVKSRKQKVKNENGKESSSGKEDELASEAIKEEACSQGGQKKAAKGKKRKPLKEEIPKGPAGDGPTNSVENQTSKRGGRRPKPQDPLENELPSKKRKRKAVAAGKSASKPAEVPGTRKQRRTVKPES
ncbi:endonuclease 8-like 1 isoform X2 [Latimeria chalumnae]|uniref:endonuclease 8-like 1 isoform X2 n=1 Tax=Latimeria chalumnae TaxID=7897 RepID=UPI0003C15EB0|nr:PREDICTED: endonuclease 8-like 1 isoform X2 [Latimeria chalumnae]|eukprot:XP_005994967.1 PREDICTED: endonuclease 8-like 1 isoform X2 [Latimeria chalumnae]